MVSKYESKEVMIEKFAEGEIYKVPIEWIDQDASVQLEERGIMKPVVQKYLMVILNHRADDEEPPFDPIEVIIDREKGVVTVGDGYQRLEAHRGAQEEAIRAKLFEGDETDARVRNAVGNAEHGEPLTQKQRAEAIRVLIKLTPFGNSEIAKKMAVSAKTVANHRKKLEEEGLIDPDETRMVTRGGQQYLMRVGDTRTKAQMDREEKLEKIKKYESSAIEYIKTFKVLFEKVSTAEEAATQADHARKMIELLNDSKKETLKNQIKGFYRQLLAKYNVLSDSESGEAIEKTKEAIHLKTSHNKIEQMVQSAERAVGTINMTVSKTASEGYEDFLANLTEEMEIIYTHQEAVKQLVENEDEDIETRRKKARDIETTMKNIVDGLVDVCNSTTDAIRDLAKKQETVVKADDAAELIKEAENLARGRTIEAGLNLAKSSGALSMTKKEVDIELDPEEMRKQAEAQIRNETAKAQEREANRNATDREFNAWREPKKAEAAKLIADYEKELRALIQDPTTMTKIIWLANNPVSLDIVRQADDDKATFEIVRPLMAQLEMLESSTPAMYTYRVTEIRYATGKASIDDIVDTGCDALMEEIEKIKVLKVGRVGQRAEKIFRTILGSTTLIQKEKIANKLQKTIEKLIEADPSMDGVRVQEGG